MESQSNEPLLLIVGSYTLSLPHVQAKGTGISLLNFDPATGRIWPRADYADIRNPTYMALSRDSRVLYAVEEVAEDEGASVVVLKFDQERSRLTAIAKASAHGDCPCHVSVDLTGERLFVSNYVSGTFAAYSLDAEGLPQAGEVVVRRQGKGTNPERQEGPHMHQAVAAPDGRHVLLCDAGTDEILRHGIADGSMDDTPNLVIRADGGSLPRHLAFSPDGRRLFVVHELGCNVKSYAYTADGIKLLTEASTLPKGWTGDSNCAAIRVHPNGKFVYASNRGHDSILVLDVSGQDDTLRAIGWHGTRGETPRDFNIDPTGQYLIAANQDGHSLAVFSIDQNTGTLSPLGDTYAIGSPVCVLFG